MMLTRLKSGKRKAVILIRERNGNTLPAVFRSEGQALSFIKSRIAKGTIVNADESGAWNDLHARYEMKRINHQEAYSLNGACTNWAETVFSRMRRAEIGHHHHVAGPYLLRYAQEAHGGRIAAGCRTASRCAVLPDWRWRRNGLWISVDIGSATRWISTKFILKAFLFA